MTNLTNHLKQMTDHFAPPMMPIERFVLEHGKDFKGVKRPKGIRKGPNKQCYMNAALLAFERGLHYVEGIAIPEGLIPMHHAWCANDAGEAIDPTWRYPEKAEYRGVVISPAILRRELLKNKVYGVLNDWIGCARIDLIEELKGGKP